MADVGDHLVLPEGRDLGRALGSAGWAEPPPFAGKGEQVLGGAVGAADAGEAWLEDAAVELPRDHPVEEAAPENAVQFSGDDVDKPVRVLSGGEKSRLVLARMLFDPPAFLVLDEPTNHLDLATKEMLVEAHHDFEAKMLFVSHDRTFLRGLASRVLEIGGEDGTGKTAAYPGTYEKYVAKSGHEAPGVHA